MYHSLLPALRLLLSLIAPYRQRQSPSTMHQRPHMSSHLHLPPLLVLIGRHLSLPSFFPPSYLLFSSSSLLPDYFFLLYLLPSSCRHSFLLDVFSPLPYHGLIILPVSPAFLLTHSYRQHLHAASLCIFLTSSPIIASPCAISLLFPPRMGTLPPPTHCLFCLAIILASKANKKGEVRQSKCIYLAGTYLHCTSNIIAI